MAELPFAIVSTKLTAGGLGGPLSCENGGWVVDVRMSFLDEGSG